MMRLLIPLLLAAAACGQPPVHRPHEKPFFRVVLEVAKGDSTSLDSVARCVVRRMEHCELAYTAIQTDSTTRQITLELIGLPKDDATRNTPEQLGALLTTRPRIEFWEMYRNTDDPMLEIFKQLPAIGLDRWVYFNQISYGSPVIFRVPAQFLDSVNQRLNDPAIRALFPADAGLYYGSVMGNLPNNADPVYELYATRGGVANRPVLEVGGIGAGLSGIEQKANRNGMLDIEIQFAPEEARTFYYLTQKLNDQGNRELGIIFQDRLLSAPSVRSPIESGRASISGGSLQFEAGKRLVALLQLPALPCPLRVLKFEALQAR